MTVAEARPDKVKALVLVEPAAYRRPIGEVAQAQEHPDAGGLRRLHRAGRALADDPRQTASRFYDAVRTGGGRYDVVDLPKAGIKGNSHMLMMDKNNGAIAELIQDWLLRRGLYR